MRLLQSLITGALLLGSSVYADGFGIGIGPFNLQFNAGESYTPFSTYTTVLDNPICDAISHQNQLEIIIEASDKVSAKEIKVVTKKLILEPYAFGITRDGKPVLRGNVFDEHLIKEVTVRYGEDQFEEKTISSEEKNNGYFSGWFKSDKSKNIDLRKVSNIRVLRDSHFDAPRNYKGLHDDNVKVICELPVAE